MSWTDYKRLIDNGNTDPAAWQAAARANPNDPRTACKLAVEQADPWQVADVLQGLARQAGAPALYELLSDAAAALVAQRAGRDLDAAVFHFARELVGFGVDAGLSLADLHGLVANLQNELTDAITRERAEQ